MKTKSDRSNLPMRLVACVLVAVCLVLGLVGLILPIIPGLLLLVVAAVIGARHFPWLERRLRRSPVADGYLSKADRFLDLSPVHKLEVGALLCVKLVLDGIALAAAAATKLLRSCTSKQRYTG